MPGSSVTSYLPLGVLILFSLIVVIGVAIASQLVGVYRRGPVKDQPYETGMPPIGDARRRFHVKFYVVAMLFLLFDVEVVLLWPWAPLFHRVCAYEVKSSPISQHPPNGEAVSVEPSQGLRRLADHTSEASMISSGFDRTYLLISMLVFISLLVIGLVYEWKRGVFKWK